MKIMVVISFNPYPVVKGTDRLIMNMVEGLSRDHNVLLVTMCENKKNRKLLGEVEKKNVEVRSIIAPNKRSFFHRVYYKFRNILISLFRGIPPEVLYHAPAEFIELIQKAATEEEVDIVLASYWHLYKLPCRLRDVNLVLITHDIDFHIHRDRLEAAGSIFRKLFAAIDAGMKTRIEKLAYQKYEVIYTLTERDRKLLKSMYSDKTIDRLPLAIDLERFNPRRYQRASKKILIMGNFSSDFNDDALGYFLKDVFPLVLRKDPLVILEIVGFGVDESYTRNAPGNVNIVGGVNDIKPYLGKCAVMVLPLRFGGGVRIRMLEAAAMGTPVVSTGVGVKGMGLADGKEYLQADSAAGMAEAILRITGNGELAKVLSRGAREWAEREIDMKSYPRRLNELLGQFEGGGD